ncbi:hypothetical protein WOA_00295 [Enterococcus faecalis EnGen0356]|uniref:DUF262 domain-containing protein n=1 Tax=Enterococcus TaxID=1350 RepID=UPI00032F044B|nr:DUF262 domain-containing protein [Enterococcus faecalis]EOJ81863.1 hypothetical protein WOA_00295 [Enterococcus faecalis EnGen0356]
MNINIEKYTVENLFGRNPNNSLLEKKYILAIPRFQRLYSWQDEHWIIFLEDVLRSWKKRDLNTDFWGSILLCKKDNIYEIVDGQQRIITLLLLQLSLGAEIEVDGKSPLLLSDNEQNEIFMKLVERKKLSSTQKRNNMFRAKQYFDNKLKNQDKQSILNFLNKTIISVIIVDDEVESNLLFGRLNTRGLKLNQVDLIKYWIFSQVEKNAGKQNNDIALQKWGALQEVSSSINFSIERFITIWWKSHYPCSTSDLLFESFKNTIPNDYINFLDKVLDTANNINILKNNNDGNDNGIGRNLKWFLKFADDSALVVLISVLDTAFSKKKKKKLIEILTVYEFMRSLVTHNINNSINPLKINFDFEVINSAYIAFSSAIVNSSIEATIDQAINNLKEIMFSNLPSSDDFQILFTNLRHCEKKDLLFEREKMLSTYAVFTLANWLDDLTRGTATLVERTTEDDEYSIEHIVPKSRAFDDTSNEYKIGNLMVLEKTINNGLGDIPVKDKISSYKKSSYPQVKQFLYKKYRRTSRWGGGNTWVAIEFDTQNINLRGEALAQEFYKHMIELLK